MKVLDATFLIDYLDGFTLTREFYEEKGGDQIRWVVPVPTLAEVLVGEGNLPNGMSTVGSMFSRRRTDSHHGGTDCGRNRSRRSLLRLARRTDRCGGA